MFLFITDLNLWPGGKCESNSCRNILPMLVSTFSEYGGLNQVILLLFLFFFLDTVSVSGGENFNWCLYPHLSSSAWYSGAARSKTSLVAEISQSLLFTPIGIFFKIEGG